MTGQIGVIGMPATARVHGGHQLKLGVIADMRFRPRHIDPSGFNRLAQRIQGLPRKFRQFVEKQNPAMRQRNFARSRLSPAADQRGHGSRMMRAAKRAAIGQAHAATARRQAFDHRNFQPFLRAQIRQNTGQAFGQHGFSRTRRAVHQ